MLSNDNNDINSNNRYKSHFDDELNDITKSNNNLSQSTFDKKFKELESKERKINQKLNEFSLDKLSKAKELEAGINSKKMKIEKLENELKELHSRVGSNKNQKDDD